MMISKFYVVLFVVIESISFFNLTLSVGVCVMRVKADSKSGSSLPDNFSFF